MIQNKTDQERKKIVHILLLDMQEAKRTDRSWCNVRGESRVRLWWTVKKLCSLDGQSWAKGSLRSGCISSPSPSLLLWASCNPLREMFPLLIQTLVEADMEWEALQNKGSFVDLGLANSLVKFLCPPTRYSCCCPWCLPPVWVCPVTQKGTIVRYTFRSAFRSAIS